MRREICDRGGATWRGCLYGRGVTQTLLDDAHWGRIDRDLGAEKATELRNLAQRSVKAVLDGLEFATAHGARRDVRRGAERLAGTAALAGLPALTQAARALERAAERGEPTDGVMKPIRALGQRSLEALAGEGS
jgi:HPt (histidine-containing phosphotransfer) domain-containing protein